MTSQPDPTCTLCKGLRWTCESHPWKPWPHDECPGPGIRCRCNPEEQMPPGTEVICEVSRS